jgi:hypothetical protein
MPVREFLDTEAGWKSSGAFEAAFNGPNTRFLLIKPLALPSVAPHYVSYRSATDQLASLSDGGSGRLADFTQTEDSRALVGLTANATGSCCSSPRAPRPRTRGCTARWSDRECGRTSTAAATPSLTRARR